MVERGVLLGAVTAVMLAIFISVSAAQGQLGFPLDDAWIHQTYARSLARTGRFMYVPGEVSTGSTSPLWSALLAGGYLLRLPYKIWAYFLGGAGLWWLAWNGMALWRLLLPEQAKRDWLAGGVILLSWKLLWGAASGMETILFAALGLQLLVLLLSSAARGGRRRWAAMGALSGLLILTRPDGLLLLLLIGAGLLALNPRQLRPLLWWGTALLLVLLPYFVWNVSASGTLWPNTFYAKQAEYAVLLERPFLSRLVSLLYFSLGGPEQGWRGMSSANLLLLPGVVVYGWHWWHAGRDRTWRSRFLLLLPLFWAGGHVLLYAWRLPVTFQHGRYLLPVQPVWILYGLAGWVLLLYGLSEMTPRIWVIRQVAIFSYGLLLLFFFIQGALAYARDVAVIEGEMVHIAIWLEENIPEDSIIAAHDIGAIGYFTQRRLLDLAGLISPEVIPYLADDSAMAEFIVQSEADYLVTAPGWPYTEVANASSFTAIYTTNFAPTAAQGLNNMTVYERIDER